MPNFCPFYVSIDVVTRMSCRFGDQVGHYLIKTCIKKYSHVDFGSFDQSQETITAAEKKVKYLLEPNLISIYCPYIVAPFKSQTMGNYGTHACHFLVLANTTLNLTLKKLIWLFYMLKRYLVVLFARIKV